jgi:DNA-directed RNA polymerase specialized sigma subunit
LQLKRRNKNQQNHLDQCKAHLLQQVKLNKDHAYLCDVAGFDNTQYFQVMQEIHRVEPYASRPEIGGSAGRSPKLVNDSDHLAGSMARARITDMDEN